MSKLLLKPILIIIIAAFVIRMVNLNFPFFNSDEARIAFRGYTIATSGKDELNRSFPLVFNSLNDYQLPAVSYITALGTFIFGKTDLGARIPFILISLLIVLYIYKVSDIFNLQKKFQLQTALMGTLTPALIYFSKVPNEAIVLTFSLLLIFYLLTRKNINFLTLVLSILFALTISKIAWFVLVPFAALTLIFFQTNLSRKIKNKILVTVSLLTIIFIIFFLKMPQSSRSFLENNFQIFQDTGTKVVLDRFRGQGLETGWPNFLEKILLNRLQIVNVGLMSWLSHLEPAVLFGQFDEEGMQGFNSMGAFPKIAILPFMMGLICILRKNDSRLKALILYPFILTFPILFMYPQSSKSMVVISIPFIIFILTLGLNSFNKVLKIFCIFIMIVEVSINILYVSPEMKNSNQVRPNWIRPVLIDSYNLSKNNEIAISDNLASDIGPFLGWFSSNPIKSNITDIRFPYKFRDTELPNIKIIGTDDAFYRCGSDNLAYIFASKRDLEKIQKWLNPEAEALKKVYYDNLNNKVVFLIQLTRCLK